ncbi:MAG: hypothetical protein GY832_28660, partial [Chloroflexi bacterium]|nr:hypothetical protein [Chloroflexota bacterium]
RRHPPPQQVLLNAMPPSQCRWLRAWMAGGSLFQRRSRSRFNKAGGPPGGHHGTTGPSGSSGPSGRKEAGVWSGGTMDANSDASAAISM